MDELVFQPTVFLILTRLIEQRGGLHYDLADQEMLAEKISPRAQELGFESLLDYYYFLRYDPKGSAELDLLLELLVVHETYFFREADQLALLVDTFLAPLAEAGGRPRVWCAAAASGEEPYTLAMLLADRKLLGKVDIVASDLSRPLIAQAKEGIYSGRALRAVQGTVAHRWLENRGTKVQVAGMLREAIMWRQVNLVEPSQIEALGQFDAILCRNVLIYFSDPTTRSILQQLTAALKAQGVLLVGGSESLMLFGTSLDCQETSGSFFYRKSR